MLVERKLLEAQVEERRKLRLRVAVSGRGNTEKIEDLPKVSYAEGCRVGNRIQLFKPPPPYFLLTSAPVGLIVAYRNAYSICHCPREGSG